MTGVKISDLSTVTPLSTDLVVLDRPTTGPGAPITGMATLSSIGAIIGSSGGATSGTFNEPLPAEFVTTASVSLAGGEGFAYAASSTGTDAYFFVSGAIGGKGGASPGVTVMGGDLHVSGNLTVDGTSPGGGGGPSFYRLEVLDYASVNATTSTVVGQVIFPANQFTGSLVLNGVIANSDPTATGSVQLYNITSGSYVEIGGVGITHISVSGTNPTIVASVDLISASNFISSSQAVYELQVSSSSPSSFALFGGFELRPSGSFTGVTTISSSVFYISGTWEDGGNRLATTASIALAGNAGSGLFAENYGEEVFFYVSGAKGDNEGLGYPVAVLNNTVLSGNITFKESAENEGPRIKWRTSTGILGAKIQYDTTALPTTGVLLLSHEEANGIIYLGGGARNVFSTNSGKPDGSMFFGRGIEIDPDSEDVYFEVSGAINSKGTSERGVALFRGDMHVSGNLTVDGTPPGPVVFAFRAVSTSDTLTITDRTVNTDTTSGNITLTLPDPALIQVGAGILIKKTNTGTSTISLARFAAENIEGTGATYLLPGSAGTDRPAWVTYSDGTDWWVA